MRGRISGASDGKLKALSESGLKQETKARKKPAKRGNTLTNKGKKDINDRVSVNRV